MQVDRRLAALGLAAMSALGALPAAAQFLAHRDLSLAQALAIAAAAQDHCRSQGYAVSVAVVGRNAEIIVQLRGDNAPPHTIENSFRRAYTALTYREPSAELEKRVKNNPQDALVFLQNVAAAQGALPIKLGEETIGAVGVSGSPGGEKDEACAQAGLAKFVASLK